MFFKQVLNKLWSEPLVDIPPRKNSLNCPFSEVLVKFYSAVLVQQGRKVCLCEEGPRSHVATANMVTTYIALSRNQKVETAGNDFTFTGTSAHLGKQKIFLKGKNPVDHMVILAPRLIGLECRVISFVLNIKKNLGLK